MARQTLFADPFTGSNGTPIAGYNGWDGNAFRCQIQSNEARQIQAGGFTADDVYRDMAGALAQDCRIVVELTSSSEHGAGQLFGMILRRPLASRHAGIQVYLQPEAGGSTVKLVAIRTNVGGVTVDDAGDVEGIPWGPSTKKRLVITFTGALLEVEVQPAGGGAPIASASVELTDELLGQDYWSFFYTVAGVSDFRWDDWTLLGPDVEPACELELEVYEDDGETVAWAVGTNPNHAYPYLLMPENYAEQELDVAKGAASLGTITVTVIDPPTTPGDQDSGWLTAKLGSGGLANLAGRRCRLRRLFDTYGTESVVLADGPAGQPTMDSSYAAFSWEIRDTRETERKLRAFTDGVVGTARLLPEGGTGIGYGYDAGSDTYLIDPVTPLVGTFDLSWPLDNSTGSVDLTGNPEAARIISRDALEKLAGTIDLKPLPTFIEVTFGNRLMVRWRPSAGGAWHEIGDSLVLRGIGAWGNIAQDVTLGIKTAAGAFLEDIAGAGKFDSSAVLVDTLLFGDARVPPDLPVSGQEIEVEVLWRGEPTAERPYYLEGLTAGQLLKALYDGEYSARDQDGAIVPTGIRYVETDVLAITTPVRLRLTQSIGDLRDWTEKYLYALTGYVPALDEDLAISPVSQAPPASTAGLPVLTDDEVEPMPDWTGGTTVYNIVRVKYQRDYAPAADDPEAPRALKQKFVDFLTQRVVADPLAQREVVVEYRDEASVTRFGPQVLELDGEVFREIGNAAGESILGTENEQAYTLAADRDRYLRQRYAYGAPRIGLAVLRSAVPGLRAGDWLVLEVSWIPDYVTGRRGGSKLAQVVARGDLDCTWLRLALEVVRPRRVLLAAPAAYQVVVWPAETEYVATS